MLVIAAIVSGSVTVTLRLAAQQDIPGRVQTLERSDSTTRREIRSLHRMDSVLIAKLEYHDSVGRAQQAQIICMLTLPAGTTPFASRQACP